MRRARRLLAAGLLTCGLLAGLGACGIPTGGRPETIPQASVPYDLTSPSANAPAVTSPPPQSAQPRVYLVGPDDALIPRGREISGSTPQARLEDLLHKLAAGPARAERQEGLTTALPPNVRLSVLGIERGTATVDIVERAQGPSGAAGRRAVAQIVLSATSLPGVDAVLLTHDGVPLDAPLPSGRLTSEPLTAADYLHLLTAAPS